MKNKATYLLLYILLFVCGLVYSQENSNLSGIITDEKGQPLKEVKLSLEGTNQVTTTDANGSYKFSGLAKGSHIMVIEFPNGESTLEKVNLDSKEVIFNYIARKSYMLSTVEIFGDRNAKQRGIEEITRFPVNTNEQIQTVSVISEKLIKEQGALTITDAARNVPGVTQFASYGGVKESMSIRGYRGTPVLKNGVRMDSDFRTASGLSDMAGVESVQIIKGSAAITQGIGDGLGSAGGVINVVTKTPRYKNSTEIGLRSGSWWNSRMQYDAQTVLGVNKNLGLRINGAFQAGKSYKDVVKNNRFYINPSFAWRPDEKTEIILEMDYMKDNTTPDRGSINLAPDTEFALHEMGSKFTGFKDDNSASEIITYAGRITRQFGNNIEARVGFFNSYYENDQTGATLSTYKENGAIIYNKRNRGIGRSFRNDRNATLQIDLMGKDINFGIFKWAWQIGYDYTMTRLDTRSAKGAPYKDPETGETIYPYIDVIDVFQPIDNSGHESFANFNPESLALGESTLTRNHYYGFMTQHHLSITDYVKIIGGLRWSYSIEKSEEVLDPMIGIMLSPIKNINLFGSYTTTSSLRSANNPLLDGGTVGVSRTKQYEFGIKSQWFNDRLRANVTYFDMDNANLSYVIYDEQGVATDFYGLAGNLRRNGVEVEIAGRPIRELQVMLGYAYLDARYEDSPAYMDDSRPMNAPYNTANAWIQYKFCKSALKGLSLGVGVYYVGDRPANEYTKVTAVHNTIPGVKYFNMPEYTTFNAQLGYELKRFDIQLFFNNITNEIGYNSYYRGGYINQIDPFNVSAQINFRF